MNRCSLSAHRDSGRKETGRFSAFKKIAAAPKNDSEHRLPSVRVPALVVMGTADPDFPDAEAEASFQAEILHAKKVMIEGAGHHPQADSPEEFASTLIEFMVEHQETDIACGVEGAAGELQAALQRPEVRFNGLSQLQVVSRGPGAPIFS